MEKQSLFILYVVFSILTFPQEVEATSNKWTLEESGEWIAQKKPCLAMPPVIAPNIDRSDINALVIGGLNKTSSKRSWWTVSGFNCITVNIDDKESFDYKANGFEMTVSLDLPEVHQLYGRHGARHGQLQKISYEHVGLGIPIAAQRLVVPSLLEFLKPGGVFSYTSFWVDEFTTERLGTYSEGLRWLIGMRDKLIPIEESDEEVIKLRAKATEKRKIIRDRVKELQQEKANMQQDAEFQEMCKKEEIPFSVAFARGRVSEKYTEIQKEIRAYWDQYSKFVLSHSKLRNTPTHSVDSLMSRIQSKNPYVINVSTDFDYLYPQSRLIQHYQFFTTQLGLKDVAISIARIEEGTAIYSFTIEGCVPEKS